jgi:hypothetical protein
VSSACVVSPKRANSARSAGVSASTKAAAPASLAALLVLRLLLRLLLLVLLLWVGSDAGVGGGGGGGVAVCFWLLVSFELLMLLMVLPGVSLLLLWSWFSLPCFWDSVAMSLGNLGRSLSRSGFGIFGVESCLAPKTCFITSGEADSDMMSTGSTVEEKDKGS